MSWVGEKSGKSAVYASKLQGQIPAPVSEAKKLQDALK
jgi:hypothetical protein